MVDNIKLFVPRCRDMPDIGCYLDSGAVEKVNIKTGEVMIQGMLIISRYLKYWVVTLSKVVCPSYYMAIMFAN